MDKTNFFNLINAGNINSGLLSENFVQSYEDFFNFPVNLKGLPILVAADPTVFEFSPDDVFEIPEDEILVERSGTVRARSYWKARLSGPLFQLFYQ